MTASLPRLPDERVQTLAEIAESWNSEPPAEDDATRGAVAEGIAQGRRAESASDADVAEAYERFRR